MKKHVNLWLVMFLAISLALPIYSMAQTAPAGALKLRLITETTGDMITSNTPIIKNFFMSGGDDKTLNIILQESLNFTFAPTDTQLGLKNGQGCTLPGDFSVNATVGTPFQFQVYSGNNGVLSSTNYIIPVGTGETGVPSFTPSSGIFQWTPQPADIGTYLAVFEGAASGLSTSQIVVMIKVNPVVPTSTLQVNSSDSGVAITVSPADNNGQASGSAPFTRTYNQNTVVTLTAPSAYNGKNFSGWSGADSTNGNQATVTMPSTGTKTATVNYTSTPTSTLQVNSSDSGVTITVSPADNNGQASGSAPFTRTYNQNTVVTLTAPSAYNGKNFNGWSGADSTNGNQATVTLPSSGTKTVTATFTSTTACQAGDLTSPIPWSQRSQGTWYFCVPQNTLGVGVKAIGLTGETDATLTWSFPDGRAFSQPLLGQGTESVSLRIWSQHTPSPNIPDDYIPTGRHKLEIIGNFQGFMTAGF